MLKILGIVIVVAVLIGFYLYYNEYRTAVQFEGGYGRTERCIKHTREFGEDYYSDSYLDRLKNVFRKCPTADGTSAKKEVIPETLIPQGSLR